MTDLEFGKRLNRYIQKSGLNNRKLAEKIGVSPASISQYVSKGRVPESGVLLKMSKALDVSMEELLTGNMPITKYQFAALINLVDRLLAKNKIVLKPEKRRMVMEEAFDAYMQDRNQDETSLSDKILTVAKIAQ